MFELKLRDLTEAKRQEMLDIFRKRKDLLRRMGGCPLEDERVKGHTECFHCDECWIAAIENSFKLDFEAKKIDGTYEQVKKILIENGVNETDINPNASWEDMGCDSLDRVEIQMDIEQNYKFDIPDSEAEKICIVQNIVDYVNEFSK